MPENKIYIGDKIAIGGEHVCYSLLDENGLPTGQVVKVLHKWGKFWQQNDAEKVRRDIEILQNYIRILNGTQVHENPVAVLRNGTKESVNYAITTPFVENFEERVVRYRDLRGPDAVKLIKEIISVIQAGHKLRSEQNVVFDPIGASEIILSFLKGIPKAFLFLISRLFPKRLRKWFRTKIGGIEGKTGNFVKTDEGIACIDTGMYDFNTNKRLSRLVKTYHTFAYTALIEMVKHVNNFLPDNQKLSCEEINSLPCEGTRIEKKIASILCRQMMIPLFDKNLKYRGESKSNNTETNTQPLGISLSE